MTSHRTIGLVGVGLAAVVAIVVVRLLRGAGGEDRGEATAPRDARIEHAGWSWSVRPTGELLRVAHSDCEWRLELDPATGTCSVARDGVETRAVRPKDLEPANHEFQPDSVLPWIDEARQKLLGPEKAQRKNLRRGPWMLGEGEDWLAFRHESWGFFLATSGSSGGWWLSVSPSRVGYIYLADFEVFLREGYWRRH